MRKYDMQAKSGHQGTVVLEEVQKIRELLRLVRGANVEILD